MMKESKALDSIARSVRDIVMEQRRTNYILENLLSTDDLKANAKSPAPSMYKEVPIWMSDAADKD